MRSSEYFQGGTGYADYPLKGAGSIRADEHPLSEGQHELPKSTKYINLFTYLGDRDRIPTEERNRPFWEHTSPSKTADGPVISLQEYDAVLRAAGEELPGGAVLIDPGEGMWVPRLPEPELYSSTLHVVSGIEVPRNIDNAQIKATTVFRKEAPPKVPQYRGTAFSDALQSRDFAPASFDHLAAHARTIDLPTQALDVVGLGGLGTGIIKSMIPDGQLKEIVRTSRHKKRT